MRFEQVASWHRFAVLGHRGSPLENTENTIESFLSAIAAGADGVELDVHLSKDEAPVVCHDPEVRTASGETLLIRATPWSELSRTDVVMGGKTGRLCRLEDVLDAIDEHLIDVELKDLPLGVPELASSRVGEVVAEVVRKHRAMERVVVTSFYIPHLKKFERIAPEIPRGWLLPPGVFAEDSIDIAWAEGMAWLLSHTSGLPESVRKLEAVVDRARDRGLNIACWTVNDPRQAQQLRSAGVQAIITDDPSGVIAGFGASGS